MLRNISRPAIFALLTLCLGILAGYATRTAGSQVQLTGIAVTLLICCWGFRLTAEGTAAMLFFLFLAVGHVIEPRSIFGGFSSPAFWLIFSGLIIGKAIKVSGLSDRLAYIFQGKGTGSYASVLARVVMAAVLFAFVVPSALGRIIILLPMLEAVAHNYGFKKEDTGFIGIMLAGVLGTYYPGFTILPSNLPNIIMAGSAETIYGITIGYMDYFLLHFPILGAGKALLLWLFILKAFPATLTAQGQERPPQAWQPAERIALVVLAAALILWMLDSIHGISPGWISLGAALIFLLLPKWFGTELFSGVKFDTLLFVACAIGVGEIIEVSGLGAFASTSLLHIVPLDGAGPAKSVPVILTMFMGTGLMTLMPSIPSVFVPLADGIAQASGLPLKSLLMLLVPAFSAFLLPYQAPPLIVTMHYGGITYRTMAKVTLSIFLFTLLIIFPLDLLWWKLLGVPLH